MCIIPSVARKWGLTATLVGEHLSARLVGEKLNPVIPVVTGFHFKIEAKPIGEEDVKYIVLVDGGYLKKITLKRGLNDHEKAKGIEISINECVEAFEKLKEENGGEANLLRILYYDSPPYKMESQNPALEKEVGRGYNPKSDGWLEQLAKYPKMALRLGVLKFRGYKVKQHVLEKSLKNLGSDHFNLSLSADDIVPDFVQKGVDMRIGIDIATYSLGRMVDGILLISGDADCVPAMKLSRKNGVSVGIVRFRKGSYRGRGYRLVPDLIYHADDVVEVNVNDIKRKQEALFPRLAEEKE